MRIVGGTHKGRSLIAPEDDRVRPTGDRIRESLFNILAHGNFEGFDLEGARVLDLFAGTGALGIEALSRGVAFALFVDDHADSRGLIRENIEKLGLTGHSKLYKRDATRLGPRPGSVGPQFSLLFCDPPYGKGLSELALLSAHEGNWLTPGALCVVEESVEAEFAAPEGFSEIDRRRYGKTEIVFMTAPL